MRQMGVKLKPCLILKVQYSISVKYINHAKKVYILFSNNNDTKTHVFLLDPPRINADDLANFIKPVVIKTGKDAAFKLTFEGREPMKIQWYNEGEELLEDSHIKIERSSSHSRLLLTKCQRKTTGEIKIKIKNECGTTEAISHLVVLGLYNACKNCS